METVKLTAKKGTHAFIGNMPFEFLSDTAIGVQANSIDHVAEMLSAAGQKAYGEHLAELAHEETVNRMVDGELKEVTLNVTYGAGGARVEKQVGEPRAVKAPEPPAPTGSVEVLPPPAVDPLATRAAEFQERTEFAPAVGRFPPETPAVMDAGEAPGETSNDEEVAEDPDVLPLEFPHLTILEGLGITKYSQLEGKTDEELSGPDYPGIGPQRAADIVAAVESK